MASPERLILSGPSFLIQPPTFCIFFLSLSWLNSSFWPVLSPLCLSSLSLSTLLKLFTRYLPSFPPLPGFGAFPGFLLLHLAAIWVSLVFKGRAGPEMLLAGRRGHLLLDTHQSVIGPGLIVFSGTKTDTAKSNRWVARKIVGTIPSLQSKETRF